MAGWFGDIFGFLWLVLCWKRRVKYSEAGSRWPSPDRSELIAADTVVWLPKLFVAEV